MSDPIEIPTITKFIEFVKDIERICNQHHATYGMIQRTAELLDDFGWEVHPDMILHAMEKAYHSSEQTLINENE